MEKAYSVISEIIYLRTRLALPTKASGYFISKGREKGAKSNEGKISRSEMMKAFVEV